MRYPFATLQRVSDSFSHRNQRIPRPITPGVDYATSMGTEIYAVEDGFMSQMYTGLKGDRYFSLTSTSKVTVWQFIHIDRVVRSGNVKEGDLIAYSGRSGRSGIWIGKNWIELPYGAPHTLVSCKSGGQYKDPETILPRPILYILRKTMVQLPETIKFQVDSSGSGIDVRQTPSVDSKVLKRLPAGFVFQTKFADWGSVIDQVGEWYRYIEGDIDGWVPYRYLHYIPTSPVTTDPNQALVTVREKVSQGVQLISEAIK